MNGTVAIRVLAEVEGRLASQLDLAKRHLPRRVGARLPPGPLTEGRLGDVRVPVAVEEQRLVRQLDIENRGVADQGVFGVEGVDEEGPPHLAVDQTTKSGDVLGKVERVLVEVADAGAGSEEGNTQLLREVVVRRHVTPPAGEDAADQREEAGVRDHRRAHVPADDEAEVVDRPIGELKVALVGELLAAVGDLELADLEVGGVVVPEGNVEGEVEQAQRDTCRGDHRVFAAESHLGIERDAVVAARQPQARALVMNR